MGDSNGLVAVELGSSAHILGLRSKSSQGEVLADWMQLRGTPSP